MEENSDVHMETDVSSTTDDVVETQEVTGSNGQVEMTFTVEKVEEDEDYAQSEIGNNMSSASIAKELQSPTTDQKSPSKDKEVSKPIQKSLIHTESPEKVTSIMSPVQNTVPVTSIELMAESADSSTKIDSLTSPRKVDSFNEPKIDNIPRIPVMKNIKQAFLIVKKSPNKDTSTVLSHIKESGLRKLLNSPSKQISLNKSPVKKPEEQNRSFQVFHNRCPSIKSPPIKLVRKQPSKDFKLHDTTIRELKPTDTTKETMSQNTIKPSTSSEGPISEIFKLNGETNTNPKPSQNEEALPSQLPCNDVPMDIIEAEVSNDSQLSSTASEKEHKSISRELKSLINSAKESKIINECTQLTSKTRKSRSNLDASLNISVEAEMIQHERRDSQASECDKPSLKRSMRSQNPDFVTKCKQFLNSVTSKGTKVSDETMSDTESEGKLKQKPESQMEPTNSIESSPKKKKVVDIIVDLNNYNKLRSDPNCWRCHWQLEAEPNEKQPVHPPFHCTICVRSYHAKCLTLGERKVIPDKNWVCPDCLQILHAESSETRSPAMKKISLGMLCDLLKFGLERMEALNGVEPFLQPVDRNEFPDYDNIVVHPMDLSQMRKNITAGHYGSTEAFIADAQWILHNSILFNASQSKLTLAARALVRTCRSEMTEIETCPECYAGAHSRNLTYFTEVCSTPHIMLWAKLKGFPYWPAKAVAINNGMVDVRFFGQHDKSWVPLRDCYLYSEKDPNTTKHKKLELVQCRQEADVHIRNICRKYGSFVYAPFKTMFDQTKMTEQLKMMIPSFDGEIIPFNDKKASPLAKESRRSTSKSSKSSYNDGDASECEEFSAKSAMKKQEDELKDAKEYHKQKHHISISEMDKTMEVGVSQTKQPETATRKRRCSVFPERPVVESIAQKKKKVDDEPEDREKIPEPDPSKEDKSESIKNTEAGSEEISKKSDETDKETKKCQEGENKPMSVTDRELPRINPIKLVALPRVNKHTPKIFTKAKVTSKSTSSTPTTPIAPVSPIEEDNTSTSKRSRITKADRVIMTEKKDLKGRSHQRNSRHNKSLPTTLQLERSDKNISDDNKKSDSGSDASTSRERSSKKKDNTDRSLLKKDFDSSSSSKPDKIENTSNGNNVDDVTLADIARENKNSGLPTISNVVSLSTTSENTNTTMTKTTATTVSKNTDQSIETTVEASSDSSIFTPTSTSNVGNMKEAVTKLQKLLNEPTTESFVGRVGVKAFARMTSPDANDKMLIQVKTEEICTDDIDENRQLEKMDLMKACKLQPVSQTQSLRDVRINKVVITPSVVVKKPTKAPEPRTRAKKSFPQPKKPEGISELNGKNSMVYIPIQPPMTQPPTKPIKPGISQHGIPMPANISAGPRSAGPVISSNCFVNTVTTPLRPIASTFTSPSHTITTSTIVQANAVTLAQVSNMNQVHTVAPTTVHTVPLMTSVNGQWMFSLQPVMSVGGDNTNPPMVNGTLDRPGTMLVPVCSSSAAPNTTVLPVTPVMNRNQNQNTKAHSSPAVNDNNGNPLEMPRLMQRPLMNPFDANTPIGSVPPPSTAGPLTAILNENAVKLTDFFRILLEDSLDKIDEPHSQITALKLQLEQTRWRNQQKLDEIKYNTELTHIEMRQTFEKEKMRLLGEARRMAQAELDAAIKLTKSKQWCSNCLQEAQFYCCWNTSYCDYNCQRTHWNTHFNQCTQEKSFRQLLQRKQVEKSIVQDESNVRPAITTHLISQDEPSTLSTTRKDNLDSAETRSHEQLPSPLPLKTLEQRCRDQHSSACNKTIIELGDQRTWEQVQQVQQQPSTSKTIIELGEQRSRDQQPSTSKTIIEIGEQRTRDQPPLSNKTIIELADQRPREQPLQSNKTIIELGDQRSRDQPPLTHKTVIELGEQRSRDQQSFQATSQNNIQENAGLLSRQLQIMLSNAKQREEVRRQLKRAHMEQLDRSTNKKKDASESRLQLGDNLPKSVPSQTPCLTTIGGKPAPMRVFTDSSGTQKTSIIVSMIEDTGGNQALKCVGTYKAPVTTQISPLLINKQASDDAAKKAVTSGGYLVVGATSATVSAPSVVTPAAAPRRPHIQYLS